MSRHDRSSPRNRVVSLCLCAVLALTLAGSNAPVAMSAATVGGGNALGELTEGGQATTPTQTTATTATTATEDTNSKSVIILATIAAVALLIGIAYVIVRDARKVAPATDGRVAEGGSARDSSGRLRRRRAKAKAARRQRKRNR